MLVYFDFETRSTVDLKRHALARYSIDPTTDVNCFAWAIDDGPVKTWHRGQGKPPQIKLPEGAKIVAHNAHFEIAIWNNVMALKYGWPLLKPEQCICTMAR